MEGKWGAESEYWWSAVLGGGGSHKLRDQVNVTNTYLTVFMALVFGVKQPNFNPGSLTYQLCELRVTKPLCISVSYLPNGKLLETSLLYPCQCYWEGQMRWGFWDQNTLLVGKCPLRINCCVQERSAKSHSRKKNH